MAFNFGEILARQSQDTVQLQAQQQQNTLQMLNQLEAQKQQNMMFMEQMRQRRLELDLQSRVQAFREAQEERQRLMDEKKVQLEERLAGFRERLLPLEQDKLKAEAERNRNMGGYYVARGKAEQRARQLPGAAGIANAEVRAAQNEIKTNEEKILDTESQIKRLDSDISKPLPMIGRDEAAAKRDSLMGVRSKLFGQIDSLKKANEARLLRQNTVLQTFQKEYGVTPEQAMQEAIAAGAAAQQRRARYDPDTELNED